MRAFYFIPLQTLQEFNISSYSSNPQHILIGFLGFLVLISIFVFLNTSKRVKKSKIFTTGKVELFEKSEDEKEIDAIVKKYSLTKTEGVLLKDILSAGRASPQETINDKSMMDDVFKTYYQRLEKEAASSKEALNDLLTLFSIRNTIAFFQNNANPKVSSKAALRAYMRKETNNACVCSVVAFVKEKQDKKIIKKFKLTNNNFSGTLKNISVGGCAFQGRTPVKAGAYLKMEFSIGKSKVAALGQLIRVNKTPDGLVFHTRFLKVPPKALCALNAFILGYQ